VRGNKTLWRRGEETHVERAWSDAEIRQALADAGLEFVARLDVTGRILADNDLPERVIMVARLTRK